MGSMGVAAASQVKFHKPVAIVKKKLEEMRLKPLTDIQVYPDYPWGWHAAVGANDRVYIFTWRRGILSLKIQPALGFRKNGRLILDS